MKKYIAIIENAFCGEGMKIGFRVFECPDDIDPAIYYCTNVDLTSMVHLVIPADKWLGQLGPKKP